MIDNVVNATLFDRYYSQNCKANTFKKTTNHTKNSKII